MDFLTAPAVLFSRGDCKRLHLFSFSPIIPQNISVTTNPLPLPSHFSCPHFVGPSFLISLLCFLLYCVFLFSSWLFSEPPCSLHQPLSVIYSFSPSCSLPLCPRLCGVVYAPFILLCNYECCSLYPHPYDEPDGYAGRWMVSVKKPSEKRVCLGRSHFPHDTSVHRP